MFKDSIRNFQGLIEFMEDLITRKNDFKVNLNFNYKQLNSENQIEIFKS